MGSDELDDNTNYNEPKLCLSSLPNRLTKTTELAVTPPIQTLASVPFKWEEAPGKPIPNSSNDVVIRPKSKAVRCLHLLPHPPAQNLSAPCSLSRSHSLSSTASSTHIKPNRPCLFASRSTRWTWSNNGGVDFSSPKVKLIRITRKSSFFSFSPSASYFLTNIYGSLKQVVTWRRRHTNSQP